MSLKFDFRHNSNEVLEIAEAVILECVSKFGECYLGLCIWAKVEFSSF